MVPRIVLLILSAGIAVFCYIESVYYAQHLAVLSGKSSGDVRIWMWSFRVIAFAGAGLTLFVLFDILRKVFW